MDRPDISPQLLPPQVPSWAMDMNVLMSAQMLMEQVAAEGGGPLLYLLYQHLLFNFHLWTFSDFAVRLGRCGDLGKEMPPGRVVVEVSRSYNPTLDDPRGHICPGVSEGNMTLPGGVWQEDLKGPSSAWWPETSADAHSGHVQYMSSIVREHRQKLRKKYGVQFILDALRTHYR